MQQQQFLLGNSKDIQDSSLVKEKQFDISEVFNGEKRQALMSQNKDVDALAKREKFSVDLRKKKRQSILDLKRKKNYQVLSKKKASKISVANTFMNIDTLKQMISNLDSMYQQALQNSVHSKDSFTQLIQILRVLREMTVEDKYTEQINIIADFDQTLHQLIALLSKAAPSIDNQCYQDILSLQCETLWIIQNLTFNETFTDKLFDNHDLPLIMQGFIVDFFLGAENSNSNIQTLPKIQELLTETLWFLGNFSGDKCYKAKFQFFIGGLHNQLYSLVNLYHDQLDKTHWQLLAWNMRCLSTVIEDQEYPELESFFKFISIFLPKGFEIVTRDDQNDETFKQDVICLIDLVFRACEDEEKAKLINGNQPLVNLVLDILNEVNPDTVVLSLNVMGDIIAIDSAICTNLVSTTALNNKQEIPRLLKTIKKIMTYGDKTLRKHALWVVSNIVVNSSADAQCILYTDGLFNWITNSLRDPVQSIKEETLWVFGNLLQTLRQYSGDIKHILQTYELESHLMLALKENWQNPTLAILIINCYDCLFGSVPEIKNDFEKTGGLDFMEDLQVQTKADEVFDKAKELLLNHFVPEDDFQLVPPQQINSFVI